MSWHLLCLEGHGSTHCWQRWGLGLIPYFHFVYALHHHQMCWHRGHEPCKREQHWSPHAGCRQRHSPQKVQLIELSDKKIRAYALERECSKSHNECHQIWGDRRRRKGKLNKNQKKERKHGEWQPTHLQSVNWIRHRDTESCLWISPQRSLHISGDIYVIIIVPDPDHCLAQILQWPFYLSNNLAFVPIFSILVPH